jgi:putative flavoprotein involved in K+ transport
MNRRVIIVGAGQSALALGHYLHAARADYVILDSSDRVGSSWSRRWDSLRLFTPARYSGLPGSPFPSARPWNHPTKDEVSEYLAEYARSNELNIQHNSPVDKVQHDGHTFLVSVKGETERADQVVIATGPFSRPSIPSFATALEARIQQIHSEAYRNPAQVGGEEVVVVGGGNSGFQIALELAQAGKRVHLSERTRARTLPQQMLGRNLFWWLDKSGIMTANPDTTIGRRLRKTEPIIGTTRRQLRKAGVVFHPGALKASADTITLADGAALRPDTVIWATGFTGDDSWIEVPAAFDEAHNLVIDAGVTPMRGLFTIGRAWQRNRGSSLLGFVGADARRLCQVMRFAPQLTSMSSVDSER